MSLIRSWSPSNGSNKKTRKPVRLAGLILLQQDQTLNEDPQPQVVLAFGLVTTKREPSSPSV
ncbi:Uncharacterised protein [Serratia quinivorans]|nr:Uncharacterised protein [Serratia quinivorans]